MKLYVLRHGLALTASEAKVTSDDERPLAALGHEEIRTMARHLQNQGASVAAILTSPLKRARETADEAAKILNPKMGISIFEPLSNSIPGPALYRALQEKGPKVPELLVVGHQPQLGEMVEHLLHSTVEILPGGLVALEIAETAKPELLWNKNP